MRNADLTKALELLADAEDRMMRSDPPIYGVTYQLCVKIRRFRRRFILDPIASMKLSPKQEKDARSALGAAGVS